MKDKTVIEYHPKEVWKLIAKDISINYPHLAGKSIKVIVESNLGLINKFKIEVE